MNLQAFMAQNARQVGTEKRVVSDRFIGEDGKPIPFEFKAITGEEEAAIRKSCMVKVKVKKHVTMDQLDQTTFLGKVAVACIVYPDLKNEELQNSYGVRGDDVLLKTMLLPGEYQEVLNIVQEINGYEKDMNELRDEAKN